MKTIKLMIACMCIFMITSCNNANSDLKQDTNVEVKKNAIPSNGFAWILNGKGDSVKVSYELKDSLNTLLTFEQVEKMIENLQSAAKSNCKHPLTFEPIKSESVKFSNMNSDRKNFIWFRINDSLDFINGGEEYPHYDKNDKFSYIVGKYYIKNNDVLQKKVNLQTDSLVSIVFKPNFTTLDTIQVRWTFSAANSYGTPGELIISKKFNSNFEEISESESVYSKD